jgi:glycosyltransferase involved in cell wall biosynthesis
MRVALVNSFDAAGGAARAARRLFHALRDAGTDATLLAAQRDRPDTGVAELGAHGLRRPLRLIDRARAAAALLPYRRSRPPGYEDFQLDRPWLGRALERELPAADVINLHWVAGMLDFASLPRLAARAPIVWTLHDMLPFTGGCHYDDGCGRFREACGACPQLGSRSQADLSARILRRRREAFARIPAERLHFVSPSAWLAAEVRSSAACGRFEASVIPYSLDLEVFRPADRAQARAALGLAPDRVIVLFVADVLDNRRKGVHLLREALAGLQAERDRVLLVSVGRARVELPEGLAHRHFADVRDDARLASIYAAADVLALPSLQDNLPNTMIEAMACATAVAGFAAGGIPDLLREGETGYLVPRGSVEGLREALRRVVRRPDEARAMGARARERVAAVCRPAAQAAAYRALFERMLGAAGRG